MNRKYNLSLQKRAISEFASNAQLIQDISELIYFEVKHTVKLAFEQPGMR